MGEEWEKEVGDECEKEVGDDPLPRLRLASNSVHLLPLNTASPKYITGVTTTPVRPVVRILRGLTLRCAECGRGGILLSWFHLRAACPHCGLLLDRGARDFFVGAYLINLIIAEMVFAIGFSVWMMRSWPNIPWDTVQWVAIVAIIAAPLITYPFTRTTWLAVDLVFQPPTDHDRVAG